MPSNEGTVEMYWNNDDNNIPQQHIIMFWESIIPAVQHHNVLGHAPA